MVRLAVLASGNGGNFQAIVEALRDGRRNPRRHVCSLLLYDRKAAFVAERAHQLEVPVRYLSYVGRSLDQTEAELALALADAKIDLVVLAGFMRLLSGNFVDSRSGGILNVHPSILPAWPGIDSVQRSFEAGEKDFGVSIHFVDRGMDTGPILEQERFRRSEGMSLEDVEREIHSIEHRIYPRVIIEQLDRIDALRRSA